MAETKTETHLLLKAETVGNKYVRCYITDDKWYNCFEKKLFDKIFESIGETVQFNLEFKGKYWNVVGIGDAVANAKKTVTPERVGGSYNSMGATLGGAMHDATNAIAPLYKVVLERALPKDIKDVADPDLLSLITVIETMMFDDISSFHDEIVGKLTGKKKEETNVAKDGTETNKDGDEIPFGS